MKIIDIIKKATNRSFHTIGDRVNEIFRSLSPVSESISGDITWIRPSNNNINDLIVNCKASCIICNDGTYQSIKQFAGSSAFILTEKPDLIFFDLLKYIEEKESCKNLQEPNIHPTAIINSNCKMGTNVKIGAFSIIDEAEIGDNTIISNNVRIFSNVVIGKNCLIREFCSIGGQGFGFVKTEPNALNHMPHIGNVIIEDDVHIFPFSNVDRATLSVTRIGKGSKIDHYCHIGHNCTVGNNTIIAAQVVTCGGVKIGNNCFIGVNTIIKEKIIIGHKVTTGLSSVVIKNIPDDEIWVGNPARKLIK